MKFFKFKLFLPLIVLFLFNSHAQAKEPLYLATTDRHGDCVHSSISTQKSQLEHNLDKQFCTDENVGNHDAIAQCIAYKAEVEAEPFYKDCGDGQSYIGINNMTYQLKRIGKETTQLPFLMGKYESKGIQVEVKKIRLLKREPDIDNAEYYESLKYEVWLIVSKGKSTTKIKGILDEGI